MELHNFKSYGGDVIVGPFKGFTAIIGTNGSGKSNLMDAISFVLGVRTAQLRGNQLRDLVYRNLEDPDDKPNGRRAQVTLVYRQTDDPVVEINFTRSVTLSGASEYRVGGRVVSLETYNNRLAEIGVLVKARNFLVFQNEVESIASKNPRDLSAMFEEVSESAEFRQPYEDARTEKDAAEEEVTHFWRKRKGMAAERRQYREQKEEAERFRRLQKQLADTRTEQALYQLFHVEDDMRLAKAEVRDAADELEDLERQFTKKESVLLSEKKRAGELEREKSKLEKKKRRFADELEKLRPMEVKYETEKSALTRRIKVNERNLQNLTDEFSTGAENVKKMQDELEACREEIKSLEVQIKEAEEASVSAQSMAEYRTLKDTVATRTSMLQQELKTALHNLNLATNEKNTLERQERELRSRVTGMSNNATVYKTKAEELKRQSQQAEQEIQRLKRERSQMSEVGAERDIVRRNLERTIDDATQALRDAKADMNQSSREQAFNNALEKMQSLFPGVHGRLSDLCQPTQARYREAVAVIFGKLMDAIVVDNGRTGADCIRYLKDQRIGIATFIPLDEIRARPVDESLRRLGGTARLAVDVIKHRDFVGKAVHYAAGNAVVCDSLEEARKLRYEGGKKIKICSLDGTLINKAGFMTGGTSTVDMNRARKWDRGEIEALKKKRQNAAEELDKLGASDVDRRTAASIAEKIDELVRRKQNMDGDRQDYISRARTAERDRESGATEVESLVPQLQNAVEAYESAKSKVEGIESRLHGLENELFGDFAERHNIATVQEFEEQFVKKSDKIRAKKHDLETKESKLSTSLKYKENEHNRSAITKLERKLDAEKSRLTDVETNLKNLGTKREEMETRAQAVISQIEEVTKDKQTTLDLIAEKRQEFRKESEQLSEAKKSLDAKRSRFEHLQTQRTKLLTEAKVAQIHIPTREGDSDVEEDEDDPMRERDGDGDVVMSGEGDGDPASMNVDVNINIDYSCLSRKHRAAATVDKQKEMLESYAEKIKTMEHQLDGLAPNMKATEHMTDVNEKLNEIDREAEAARERARKAVALFEDLKQKRQDRFNSCFTHIANKINDVYKELTKSTAYPMGGTAYLSLEQQDEPYLGGIKFNAMPPTKRFRDMEQLSGGERTVAALALLFAIHDFRPSPFFVLDEVDAALDNLNVGRVSSYIKSRAPDLQTIVISLKDAFFERADALVGIHRDISVQSSRLLTIDLTEFDDVPPSQPAASQSQPVTT